MNEFIEKVFNLPKWEIHGDIHGLLAMTALVLFGAAIFAVLNLDKLKGATAWLKALLAGLAANLAVLNIYGLFVYVPYRAKGPDSSRSRLLENEETAWLHQIVFEHKEFLAYAPFVLAVVALVIAWVYRDKLATQPLARRAVLFSLVTALVFVLVVAAEAVLVTKAAPLTPLY